ncbi:MAG TPA: hypothetical protein DCZ04_08385 [Syntrophorhabdus aromaticivorans]|nr:hypothetical protein [Syntrophorhabdus aromaticivorans]
MCIIKGTNAHGAVGSTPVILGDLILTQVLQSFQNNRKFKVVGGLLSKASKNTGFYRDFDPIVNFPGLKVIDAYEH